jgi:hypothetical protein
VEVATKSLPFYGGEDNPYLLGVSPIGAWMEKESGYGAVAPGKPVAPAKNGGNDFDLEGR